MTPSLGSKTNRHYVIYAVGSAARTADKLLICHYAFHLPASAPSRQFREDARYQEQRSDTLIGSIRRFLVVFHATQVRTEMSIKPMADFPVKARSCPVEVSVFKARNNTADNITLQSSNEWQIRKHVLGP